MKGLYRPESQCQLKRSVQNVPFRICVVKNVAKNMSIHYSSQPGILRVLAHPHPLHVYKYKGGHTYAVRTISPMYFLAHMVWKSPPLRLWYMSYMTSSMVSERRTLCEISAHNITALSYCRMEVMNPGHTSSLQEEETCHCE